MSGSGRDLAALARVLGHDFSRPEILEQALRHSSAPEVIDGRLPSYQRLEFLGDRVLGMVVADMVFHAFPQAPEGELSRRLTLLVRKETCAEIAQSLDLGRFVRMGEGEARSGGRRKRALLGDVCEAVIAALYLDGGMDVARRFVETHWVNALHAGAEQLQDAKTALQEWAHARGVEAPTYRMVERSGPDHSPEFRIEVIVPGLAGETGIGRSKRIAEQEAARLMLIREGAWT
jgi:ribonuclease-3